MFDVTPFALGNINLMAAGREKYPIALRVGLKGGGCGGYEYVFEWADNIEEGSIFVWHIDHPRSLSIISDPKSLVFLEGATLDYEKTLMRSGFKWINPKQTGTCGCGKSATF